MNFLLARDFVVLFAAVLSDGAEALPIAAADGGAVISCDTRADGRDVTAARLSEPWGCRWGVLRRSLYEALHLELTRG